MSDAVDIVALNKSWRVVVAPAVGRTSRAWHLQQLADDGAWCGRAIFRASGMLRNVIGAWCGDLDEGAQAALASLPARVDHRPRGSEAPRLKRPRKEKPAEVLAEKAPPPPPPEVLAPPPPAMKREPRHARRKSTSTNVAVENSVRATAVEKTIGRDGIELAGYWRTYHGIR